VQLSCQLLQLLCRLRRGRSSGLGQELSLEAQARLGPRTAPVGACQPVAEVEELAGEGAVLEGREQGAGFGNRGEVGGLEGFDALDASRKDALQIDWRNDHGNLLQVRLVDARDCGLGNERADVLLTHALVLQVSKQVLGHHL